MISICLKSHLQLEQEHIDRIRLTLLTGALEHNQNIDVTSNITDIHGNKLTIKTTNLKTVDIVKKIMENDPMYKTIDEDDVPGLKVKIIVPKWLQPLIEADQFIKVITLHHPLESTNFTQYQPARKLQSGSMLFYTSLDYRAQTYFAHKEWKLTLLGTTLSLRDAEPGKRSSPGIQQDKSPDTSIEQLNLSN